MGAKITWLLPGSSTALILALTVFGYLAFTLLQGEARHLYYFICRCHFCCGPLCVSDHSGWPIRWS